MFVAAAGRAIMDLMQSEWEPLSYWELDQRLDRAVEEMLDADLMAQGQSSSVFIQASPEEGSVPGQLTPESGPPAYEFVSGPRAQLPDPTDGHPAVKVTLLSVYHCGVSLAVYSL